MGSNMNFGNEPPVNNGGSGSRPPGNFPLSRQPSVYSLTFDEFQSTVGGLGKDYGSMNMDELLKSIWTAEEIQSMASGGSISGQDGTGAPLQRQGSLTLPRTLSQKTVDEVWKDISKEYAGGKNASGSGGTTSMPQTQRQQTLGEMTLEEFLMRAGVVREDMPLTGKTNTGGFLGDLAGSGNNNTGLGFGFQQMGRDAGLMGDSNQIPQSSNLPLNVNGVRSNQQQQQQQLLQPQLFPKQPAMAYGSQMPLASSAGIRAGVMGVTDQGINNSLVQNSALQGGNVGMVGLGAHAGVATGSPAKPISSSDGIGKSTGDTSSVSPVPYMFNGGLRGRRSSAAVDKVIERRQRRMIKNRESAARSRARKQAYTMELEAENAKLKEENEELRRKQAELMETHKNQTVEMMNLQRGVKRPCLRRTLTGPW